MHPVPALALAFLISFAPVAHAVTIVYSNDVMGEIEPCGCRKNPTGGLARKYELIKKIADPELIQVDAGNLLFETQVVPSNLAPQAAVQARYLLQVHDLLGHDLVTPGLKDFGLGKKLFLQLVGQATRVRFISSNIVDQKTGKPILESSAVLTRNKKDGTPIRIAFIGVTSPEGDWSSLDLTVKDPHPAVREELARLKGKYDKVYVLSQLGLHGDELLAKSVPGIDGIFGGRTQSLLQNPPRFKTTTLYQAAFRNQYVGTLNLESGEHQLHQLDPAYDPKGPNDVTRLVDEFKAKVAEENQKLAASQTARLQREGGVHTAFQTFPKCMECHQPQTDFWRKTAHANALQPLIDAKQAQNKECLGCHTVGMDQPGGFTDVTRLAETASKEPIPLDEWAAFLKEMRGARKLDSKVKLWRNAPHAKAPLNDALTLAGRAWTPVQCENCHGPAGEHPFGSLPYPKTVQNETCLKCHTTSRASEWYTAEGQLKPGLLEKKRSLIACPSSAP